MDRLNYFFGVRLTGQNDLISGTQIIIIRSIGVYPCLSFKDVRNYAGRKDYMVTTAALRIVSLTVDITTSRALHSVGVRVQVGFRLYLRFLLGVCEIQFYILIDARRFRDQGRC